MTALFIIGIVTGLLGWWFFWLNQNSPIQTPFPAFLWPVSIVCLILFFGKLVS